VKGGGGRKIEELNNIYCGRQQSATEKKKRENLGRGEGFEKKIKQIRGNAELKPLAGTGTNPMSVRVASLTRPSARLEKNTG